MKVPSGRNLIVIDLNDYYKTLKNEGITIKGYGFSVNSIYIIEDNIESNIKNNIENNIESENKGGISEWAIIFIILVCLLVIAGGVFILLNSRKNKIEKEIDSLNSNEKMLY